MDTSPPATNCIQVLVVEGEFLLRAGLSRLLAPFRDIRVVGQAGTTNGLLERLRRAEVDVVVMGGRLEDGRAAGAIAAARTAGWRTPILMLGSSYQGPHSAAEAVRAGASGFMPTNANPEQLAQGIRKLHAGLPLFEPSPQWAMTVGPDGRARVVTPREREVLAHIERGLSNRQIGIELGIAMRTVDKHVENLMRKFDVRNRRDLADEFRAAAS